MSDGTKGMMKWPLIIAAALVLLRLVLEQAGAPETVNNILGVSWLYFITPVYFANRIVGSGDTRPFRTLFKTLLVYITYTRLMIIPTYWLAYMLRWKAPRFGLQMGGVVGEGISPVEGYLWIPVRNALVWIVGGTIIGMIIGGVTLLIRRRGAGAPRTA